MAALRGEMELSLTDAGSRDAHRQKVASQLEEIDKLARLVGQLLLLAQADAGEIPLQPENVDLAVLSASVVEAYRLSTTWESHTEGRTLGRG